MRAAHAFRALGLGAALALSGCVAVHESVPRDAYADAAPYGPTWSHDGVQQVWDGGLGAYTVAGLPQVYWTDGWYWRDARGYWERGRTPHGRWSRVDGSHVPARLHARSEPRPEPARDVRWDRRGDEDRDPRYERSGFRRDLRDERETQRESPPQRAEARHEEHQERVAERREERQEHADARRERREQRRQDRDEQHDRYALQ